jgi:hypothetical protein
MPKALKGNLSAAKEGVDASTYGKNLQLLRDKANDTNANYKK